MRWWRPQGKIVILFRLWLNRWAIWWNDLKLNINNFHAANVKTNPRDDRTNGVKIVKCIEICSSAIPCANVALRHSVKVFSNEFTFAFVRLAYCFWIAHGALAKRRHHLSKCECGRMKTKRQCLVASWPIYDCAAKHLRRAQYHCKASKSPLDSNQYVSTTPRKL